MLNEIKQSNTVAVLGGPYAARELLKNHEPRDIDVWWLNTMWKLKDWDDFEPYITMYWDMHPFYRMERRRQYDHIDWLTDPSFDAENELGYADKRNLYDYPIMMRRKYARVPGSIGYPIRKVVEQLPHSNIKNLFGCTHSWMMGLALYLGYDRIECYGVNLINPIESYLEKPSWAIWYGAALYNGVDVDLTHSQYVLPTVLYGVGDRLAQLHEQYIPEIVTAYCVGVERYDDMQALTINEKDWSQINTIQHRRVEEQEEEPLQVYVDSALEGPMEFKIE